jgi:hypothetical protein
MIKSRSFKREGKRPAGFFLLVAVLLTAHLFGCEASSSYENSVAEAPPSNQVDPAVRALIQKQAENFNTQLREGNTEKAVSFFSADFEKQMPVEQLSQSVKSGPLKPLISAGPLRFEPIQINRKGDRATVRLAFDTPEQKNWRMNLSFEKTGSDWKIANIVSPVKHTEPIGANSQAAGAAK